MKPLDGTITPAPKLPNRGEPASDAILYRIPATYQANTTYTFRVDLVPNDVLRGTETGRFCINEQSTANRAARKAILASPDDVRYSVAIRETGTFANIPAFLPQRTLHESFTADGAADCGPTPPRGSEPGASPLTARLRLAVRRPTLESDS